MLTPEQVGGVLGPAGVVDPKVWAALARGATDLAVVLSRVAAGRPPWWDGKGTPPPGLTPYQREAIMTAAEENDPAALRASVRLNRYILLDMLGAGGQGKLYRARQVNPGRYAAVKVLLRDRDIDRQRFEQEAQVLMQIVHPAVARFYAYERIRDAAERMTDLYLMAMEYVEGTDLEPLVRRTGPVPPVVVARWGVQLLEGLDALHRAGFLHRDVKPQNVRVLGVKPGADLAKSRVKLLDFGLVRPLNAPPDTGKWAVTFVGSSEYAPAEQWPGGTLSPATDYYALGGTLYYALTGKSPFFTEPHDPMRYFRSHVHDPVPAFPAALKVPRDLARVVTRMLAKSPGDRGTIADLLDGFKQAGGTPPLSTPKPSKPVRVAPKPVVESDPDIAVARPADGLLDLILTWVERLAIPGYQAGDAGRLGSGERVFVLLLRPRVWAVFAVIVALVLVWWMW
jgi:serine/threonine protein kinase